VLSGVSFDIKPDKMPDISLIATAHGLSQLTFERSPITLTRLRKEFEEGRLRAQANEITYAIKLTQLKTAGPIERLFNFLLFDQTCRYGMAPQRALKLFSWGILVFALLYIAA